MVVWYCITGCKNEKSLELIVLSENGLHLWSVTEQYLALTHCTQVTNWIWIDIFHRPLLMIIMTCHNVTPQLRVLGNIFLCYDLIIINIVCERFSRHCILY